MSKRAWRAAPLVCALACALAQPARAHPFEPPLLSLTEREAGVYDVVFRLPGRLAEGDLEPVFPQGTQRLGAPTRVRDADATVERFRIRVGGGLAGKRLSLRAAPGARDEVLLRIASRSGLIVGQLAAGGAPFEVPQAAGRLAVVRSYLGLGVEHIATGIDHLLFVLTLILLARSLAPALAAITAFTLAHSLTLAAAVLGWIAVPSPPVEALIALSIVFAARELRQRGTGPYSRQRLWLMALGFGLLHGLGFAGALTEIGLPPSEVPLALFGFNAGVELGQLGFVLLVLGVGRALPARVRARLHDAQLPAYGIGSLAAWFFFERLALCIG